MRSFRARLRAGAQTTSVLLAFASVTGALGGCATAPAATLADDAPQAAEASERAAQLRAIHRSLQSHPDAAGHAADLERAEAWLELAEIRAGAVPRGAHIDLLIAAAEGELLLVQLALKTSPEDRHE